MIHEQFAAIPDKYIAEVFSEPFVEPGVYKFASTASVLVSGSPDLYPPVPAYPAAITAAFFAENGRDVRRFTVPVLSGGPYTVSYDEARQKYAALIGGLQDQGRSMNAYPEALGLEPTDERFGALGKWTIAAAERANRRLIVAHLLHVTHTGREVIDALVYPATLQTEFPALLRQSLASPPVASPDDMINIARLDIATMLATEAGALHLTDIAASSVLPDVDQFSHFVRPYLR